MEAEELKKAVEAKQQEVESIERNKTWNWENMCHVTEERTIINKSTESEVESTQICSTRMHTAIRHRAVPGVTALRDAV